MDYRINGFEQIKAFYSWVFNNPDKARPTHISLYLFLVNQNNRANWVEWFKCPYDLAMQGACIGNNGTYYKCLDELKKWKLIDYKKGVNNFKAPLVKLFVLYKNEQLNEQVTVPLSEQASEQLSEQQYAQLSEQLPVHIYKLITDNIKLITDNEIKFAKFIKELSIEKEKPLWKTNFETYQKELRKAWKEIITQEYVTEREKYHPHLDIRLTIEKSCKDYWSKEVGWKKKKASKTENIDWEATFNNALTQKQNQVWKTNQYSNIV